MDSTKQADAERPHLHFLNGFAKIQLLLSNSVAVVNLTQHDEVAMKTPRQFAIAMFVALAVFVVFVCPLTLGPPAPQQKLTLILALFAWALAAVVVLLRAAGRTPLVDPLFFPVSTAADRLALICTRLC